MINLFVSNTHAGRPGAPHRRGGVGRGRWRTSLACVVVLTTGVVSAQQPASGDAATNSLSVLEAVRMTLQENPILHSQEQQVDVSRGSLLSTQGAFDTTLAASVQQGRMFTPLTAAEIATALGAGIDTGAQTADTTTVSLGAQRLLRNGDIIGSTVSLARNKDNLLTMTGLNRSQVAFQLTIPLLRSRGREVVAAPEDAARLEVDASTYDVSQLASQLIAGTATSYWQYVGAIQVLAVQRASEERGRQLLDDVQELIRTDQLAQIEANTVIANAASRSAARVSAELSVVQAEQSLASAIGLGPDAVQSLKQPVDPFPDVTLEQPIKADTDSMQRLVRQALERRADYLAAQKRLREFELQLVAATNQLKPQVNLEFSAGYAGLQEANRVDKYLSSLFQNLHGPNVTGTLNYQFPYESSQARGGVMQAQARLQQARLRQLDVARNVSSAIVVAVSTLNSSVEQLKNAKIADDAFRDALQGERDKLRLGVGSIIDILQVEDRYISANLRLIQAQIDYASAIANFRFATGTYLAPDQPVQAVRRDLFFEALSRGSSDEP